MKSLEQYKKYTREDVHDIFSEDTRFIPQRGAWGMHGVVRVPNRPNDYVFFVTLGKEQGYHIFDESISTEGVLSWQSQPSQTLNDTRVKQWIEHNELENNIYLFLRTKKINPDNKRAEPYTYLGPLAYISHDIERKKPVHFQWQILDWNQSKADLDIEYVMSKPLVTDVVHPSYQIIKNTLIKTDAPDKSLSHGTNTRDFRGRKIADYSSRDIHNKKLGDAGEKLVLNYEIAKLKELGRTDLADKVKHTSKIEGDGTGYDVKSYDKDGGELYIEVKTTMGNERTPFFISVNEAKFSELNKDKFILYRVYNFDLEANSGDVFMIHGCILEQCNATPTNYKVRI